MPSHPAMPAWTPLVSGLRSGGGRRAAAALVAALVAAALVFCLRLHAGAGPRSGLLPCCLLDGRASAQLPLRAEPGPALEVVRKDGGWVLPPLAGPHTRRQCACGPHTMGCL